MSRWLAGCLLAAAVACAQAPVVPARYDSLLPGSIGVALKQAPGGVVIAAVRDRSPAAAAGLRVGDVVRRYDGVSVVDTRQLYRLMLDSAPGSAVVVELERGGEAHRIVVPVGEIDTALRA